MGPEATDGQRLLPCLPARAGPMFSHVKLDYFKCTAILARQAMDTALEGSHTDLSHQGPWQRYFVSRIYILLWLLLERHHLECGCESKPDGVYSHHFETARVFRGTLQPLLVIFCHQSSDIFPPSLPLWVNSHVKLSMSFASIQQQKKKKKKIFK